MIYEIAAYIAGTLLVIGALFSVVASIGLLRLPDLYSRMHAASKTGTMGAGLSFVAIALVAFDGPVILRAIVGFTFLMLTAPVSAHLLARAACLAGYKPENLDNLNDFAKDRSK